MPLKIMDGATLRTISALKVMDGATLRTISVAKVCREYEDPNNPGNYLKELVTVFELAAEPDIAVPGVSIERDPPTTFFGPVDHIVSWTVETDSSADAYSWNVRVNWYVNGTMVSYDLVAQSVGSVTLTGYDVSDDVYAVVYYVNNEGAADPSLWVTTSTV